MLTADRREALQEIANIGMGQAGATIAEALNHFVLLSIPRVKQLKSEELPVALRQAIGSDTVTAVRESFHGGLRGEAIVIYGAEHCSDLAELMGHAGEVDREIEREVLLKVSSLLASAFLGGIAQQLRIDIAFSTPALLASAAPLQSLCDDADLRWKSALLVEVNFRLETRSFACHVVALMPDSESSALAAVLDSFLENL